MSSLQGKTALVTGSGRGLGKVMAQRLADQGANIVLHDINLDAPEKYKEAQNLGEDVKEFKKQGAEVLAVTENIGNVQAVAAICTRIEEKCPKVDILVNCAGGDIGASGGKPSPNNVLDIPIEDVQSLINNNLIGTINVCKAFIPAMRDQKSGVVVNIGSVARQFVVSEGQFKEF